MKTPTKFVKELNEKPREEFYQLMKTSNEPVRRRPVSLWLGNWEDRGVAGLQDQEGRGRPPILNEKEQKQAIQIVEKDPRSARRSLGQIAAQTGKSISADTLKRLLKKGGKTWKRLRRSVRGKRDEAEFRAAQVELAGFRAQAAAGAIDLYYFDGAGFTLDPCVPCAWQTVGETIEIPAATSDRPHVLAFFSLDHQFHPFSGFRLMLSSHRLWPRMRSYRVTFILLQFLARTVPISKTLLFPRQTTFNRQDA